MAVRQVDGQVAALLGDGGADMDVFDAVPVVIQDRLAVIDAVRPLRDHRTGLALRPVQHRLDRGMGGGPAEFPGQGQQAALTDMGRAGHRREVAPEIIGMAYIDHQHLQHVPPHSALRIQPQRRDADALLPDLGRRRIVGAMRRAADVGLVRPVDRPEHRRIAIEHRHEHRQIREVIAAVIRIIEQEHVAAMDIALEKFADRPRRPGQGTDMDRDMLGLCDQAPVEPADRGRKITR